MAQLFLKITLYWLINIEKHVEIISKELNIDFEIYGFDLSTGLPKSDYYKDMTYAWNPGAFEMDVKKLKERLRKSKKQPLKQQLQPLLLLEDVGLQEQNDNNKKQG